jgi:hypothetical protein
MPPCDLWLPGIGAEFGLFTNGTEGVKGYVDVPVFGKIGVFAGSGRFVLGNVSEYTLYIPPENSQSPSLFSSKDAYDESNGGYLQSRIGSEKAGTTSTSLIGNRSISLDRHTKPSTDTYKLFVPGKTEKLNVQSINKTAFANESISSEPERIIFVFGYPEGDPKPIVESPSRKTYEPGQTGVEVMYDKNAMYMSVMSSETGEWTLFVDGMYGADMYKVVAYVKTALPVITVSNPAENGERHDESFTINGTADAKNGKTSTINIYRSKEKNFSGELIAETTTDSSGIFSTIVQCQSWEDGEYFIFAGISTNENDPEMKAYAPGSIIVDHGGRQLAQVTDFVAIDKGNRGIDISFTDPNGERTTGYRVFVENLTVMNDNDPMYKKYQELNVGLLTRFTVPGFAPGHTVRVKVAPIDLKSNIGPLTAPITVTMGLEKQIKNSFDLIPETLSVDVPVNGSYSFDIPYTVSDMERTNTPLDTMEPDFSTQIDTEEHPEFTNVILGYDNLLYDLPAGNGVIHCTVNTIEQCLPGTYPRTIKFKNRGNNAIVDSVEVVFNVTRPQVVITGITPKEWNTLEAVTITVSGDNFYPGTKLYIDANELAIEKSDRYGITAHVNAGLTEGMHIIKIEGQDGNTATTNIEVLVPYYYIVGYKTIGKIPKGGTGTFVYSIKGEDGFTGTAAFSVNDVPDGWTASIDNAVIGVEQLAHLTVGVPQSATEGIYIMTVTSGEGFTLPIDIEVSGVIPAPYISSISDLAALTGDTISIFGYGFLSCLDGSCPNPEVKLGELAMNVISATSDMIVVQIPQNGATGDIVVSRNGLVSNAKQLYIKTFGYSIHPEKSSVTLKPGESKSIKIYVNGYARSVDLSASSDSSNITAALSETQVNPNATIDLILSADSTASTGTHSVTISGNSGGVIVQSIIEVDIAGAFGFVEQVLPRGTEETPYYAKLETTSGSEPVIFALTLSSELPPGLVLRQSGEITGKPQAAGMYGFTISATDAEDRTITATYQIIVTDNGWYTDENSAGATNHSPVNAPSTDRVVWTSGTNAGFTGDKTVGSKSIMLKYGRRIIAIRNNTIHVRFSNRDFGQYSENGSSIRISPRARRRRKALRARRAQWNGKMDAHRYRLFRNRELKPLRAVERNDSRNKYYYRSTRVNAWSTHWNC